MPACAQPPRESVPRGEGSLPRHRNAPPGLARRRRMAQRASIELQKPHGRVRPNKPPGGTRRRPFCFEGFHYSGLKPRQSRLRDFAGHRTPPWKNCQVDSSVVMTVNPSRATHVAGHRSTNTLQTRANADVVSTDCKKYESNKTKRPAVSNVMDVFSKGVRSASISHY